LSKCLSYGKTSRQSDISSIVALSGLGSHAFGSFKERKGTHMWLRDDLPFDFPTARVFIYGYDTTLADSRSFQDLEALANAFRLALKTIRPDFSVSTPAFIWVPLL
jgi:hypothetical protein